MKLICLALMFLVTAVAHAQTDSEEKPAKVYVKRGSKSYTTHFTLIREEPGSAVDSADLVQKSWCGFFSHEANLCLGFTPRKDYLILVKKERKDRRQPAVIVKEIPLDTKVEHLANGTSVYQATHEDTDYKLVLGEDDL